MRQTVAAAKKLNVAVGPYPSYPDRENSDGWSRPCHRRRWKGRCGEQIAALAKVAERLGVRLVHVKPHGALYHATNKDREIA